MFVCPHVIEIVNISEHFAEQVLAFEDAYRWADFVGVTGYMTAVDSVTSAWSALSLDQVLLICRCYMYAHVCVAR